MKRKTFNIGEYCKGGVITAEVEGTNVTVIGKDWDVSAGCSKNSNQSNAKEFTRLTVDMVLRKSQTDLFMFLTDLTTAYYADQVTDWIKKQI